MFSKTGQPDLEKGEPSKARSISEIVEIPKEDEEDIEEKALPDAVVPVVHEDAKTKDWDPSSPQRSSADHDAVESASVRLETLVEECAQSFAVSEPPRNDYEKIVHEMERVSELRKRNLRRQRDGVREGSNLCLEQMHFINIQRAKTALFTDYLVAKKGLYRTLKRQEQTTKMMKISYMQHIESNMTRYSELRRC